MLRATDGMDAILGVCWEVQTGDMDAREGITLIDEMARECMVEWLRPQPSLSEILRERFGVDWPD